MAVPDSAQLHDVLILGAGPAGLAVGGELKRRGVSFLIVERGEGVAHSWQHMPARMKLVSPWKANWLPGARADALPANAEISRADYCAWLQNYARELALLVLQTPFKIKACYGYDGKPAELGSVQNALWLVLGLKDV